MCVSHNSGATPPGGLEARGSEGDSVAVTISDDGCLWRKK